MDHSQRVDGGFLKAAEDASKLLESSEESFDDVAATIGFSVKVGMIDIIGLLSFFGDHRLNAFRSQLIDDLCRAVGFVPGQCVRLDEVFQLWVAHLGCVPQVFEELRLVSLSGAEFRVQRATLAVADDVDFRRESPTRAAQRMVCRFVRILFFPPPPAQRCARTMLPSIDHRLWSNRSSALNRDFKRATAAASVPSEVHRLKGANTVSQGPSSLGRSRHGAPARKIQQMPSIAARAAIGGRPVALG